MIPLLFTQDANGNIGDGTRQASFFDYFKLAADVGQTLLVPTGANHVLFSCSTNFFVQYTSDAITSALYAASNSQASGVSRVGTTIELNPSMRSLKGVTGLGVIGTAAGNLTLSWYG